MKKIRIIIFLLLLGVVVWWLLHRSPTQTTINPGPAQTNEVAVQEQRPATKAGGDKATKKSNDVSSTATGSMSLEERKKRRTQLEEQSLNEWRAPINFYGKVVDEKEQPVEGAQISFLWNDLSSEGTSRATAASDSTGLFSLLNKTGKGMSLKITKEGYYTSTRDNKSFEYGDRYERFVPDANNPVVFHLRKKGQAESLIAASGRIKVPLNGTPIEIDLSSGNVVPAGQGQLKVECLSDYKNKTNNIFNWKLSVSVPGGGIMQSTNEFDFEAAEQGYENIYEIQMPGPKETGWTQMLDRKLFLKLPNGNFGKFSFSFIAYNGVFRFESFINPSGSRNLEYDEAVQPK